MRCPCQLMIIFVLFMIFLSAECIVCVHHVQAVRHRLHGEHCERLITTNLLTEGQTIVSINHKSGTNPLNVIHNVFYFYFRGPPPPPLPPTFAGFLANATVKVAAISLKLEIKLHAHQLGMNTQSNNEVTFTLVWLAHAIRTRLVCIQFYFRLERQHTDFRYLTLNMPKSQICTT